MSRDLLGAQQVEEADSQWYCSRRCCCTLDKAPQCHKQPAQHVAVTAKQVDAMLLDIRLLQQQ